MQKPRTAALNPALSRPFKYKPLKSARIMTIKDEAKKLWQKIWNENIKTAIALRRITKRKDTKSGPSLYNGLSNRNIMAKLVQLRTGHCGLNRYLHRFGLKNTPYCECGYGKETVEHFFLHCPKYKEQRKKLRKEVRGWNMRVDKLLGEPKLIGYTMEYVNETGRLK